MTQISALAGKWVLLPPKETLKKEEKVSDQKSVGKKTSSVRAEFEHVENETQSLEPQDPGWEVQ